MVTLMNQGVSRDLRPRPRNMIQRERERAAQRRAYEEATFDPIYRTLPEIVREGSAEPTDVQTEQRRLGLPEETLLYFLEKNAPTLEDWQRELLRIVRLLSQYFYPQRQTKMMNEGCATFVHYEILNRLYERGQLTDGTMLEFLHSHSSVVFQPAFIPERFGSFTFTVDRWKIKQEQIVGLLGAQTALTVDYLARVGGGSNPLVVRDAPTQEDIDFFAGTGIDPVGQVIAINDRFINLQPQTAGGLDFGVDWSLRRTRFGSFSVNLNATRLLEFTRKDNRQRRRRSDYDPNTPRQPLAEIPN
jgi:hypothetical protein